MESSTEMGMIKIGIIELIMWTVYPVPMSNPMVQITETIATIMGETIKINLRKKKLHVKRR